MLSDPKPCPPKRKALIGFTLLEVLVALGIVAIALVAALRAVGTLTRSADEARLRVYAQWAAENRLVQFRLDEGFPSVGRVINECAQGGVVLTCESKISQVQNVNFRRVDVRVYEGALDAGALDAKPYALARMTGFMTTFR